MVKAKYITMIVNNTKESVDYYCNVLGFQEDSVYHPPGNTEITLMRGPSETMIELIQSSQFPTGLYSIGMDVDNLEETIKEIEEKGGKILMPPAATLVGRMTFTEDPNGVRIALIEHNMDYALKKEG